MQLRFALLYAFRQHMQFRFVFYMPSSRLSSVALVSCVPLLCLLPFWPFGPLALWPFCLWALFALWPCCHVCNFALLALWPF